MSGRHLPAISAQIVDAYLYRYVRNQRKQSLWSYVARVPRWAPQINACSLRVRHRKLARDHCSFVADDI